MTTVTFKCDDCEAAGEIACVVDVEDIDVEQLCAIISKYHVEKSPDCEGEVEAILPKQEPDEIYVWLVNLPAFYWN